MDDSRGPAAIPPPGPGDRLAALERVIIAAYKFAGVPDPERLAAAFLAQAGRE